MTYQEAKELKEKNQHLLNTTTDRGFIISEILIVPKEEGKRNYFFSQYLKYDNADIALAQYLAEDLVVWAIDKNHLKEFNVLFYKELK